MAYTALKEKSPVYRRTQNENLDMKSAAVRFLHDTCEELRFDVVKEKEESDKKIFLGTSLTENQIPYNMQMDIERLCMENALNRFLESGVAQDAFDVYFCYLEMFVGSYGQSRRMIELLSEFESNGSSLLMKHRDHYSHSVYVFALGLAIYETNEVYRREYRKFYGLEDAKCAAHHFLQYWGLSALFHDIGYPFELPFEQVASYFEVGGKKRRNMPFISYNGIEAYMELPESAQTVLNQLYHREFQNANELFAYDIAAKLAKKYGKSEDEILATLRTIPARPDARNYFMDHAYFSAAILSKELFENAEILTTAHVDALTAILLHNSLYKFSITNWKDEKVNQPFAVELHPLAFMLMLCDELQCWDRTSYGRNSRTELHPMDCEFSFLENGIQATYLFDEAENKKIIDFWQQHDKYLMEREKNPDMQPPKLKAYSGMVHENEFLKDIQKIVDLKEIPLFVSTKIKRRDNQSKHTYLSNSNFIHLYNFAVALNARYSYQGREENVNSEELEQEFESLSLEYKLSNIGQAKAFAGHLDAIGCFYTDRPVAYPMVQEFTAKDMDIIGPLEHERWLKEHREMGWKYGTEFQTCALDGVENEKKERKRLREQMRVHDLMMDGEITREKAFSHYRNLSTAEQDKDVEPMNSMLGLIEKYDGLRIYRLPTAEMKE